MKEFQTSLQDILFWAGAVPIAMFSIGQFGDFIGRGDSSNQLSRSVTGQSPNQKAIDDANDGKTRAEVDHGRLIYMGN